jgi:hypothetical protein
MFDWSGIDDVHETVVHNSMLLVGALDAGRKCAAILQDETRQEWLDTQRATLVKNINRLWQPESGTYPDSLVEDGSLSTSVSQHTSFLALLYDIVPETHAAQALENVLDPPEGMVRVGSPFVMLYYYEALERVGKFDAIVQSIRASYTPMLREGATTVWEVFPSSDDRPGGFPTRSHAHAWSSAPAYFLNRIILGIRLTEPGGTACSVSPRPSDLSWADGTVAAPAGAVHVRWQDDGTKMQIIVKAPAGTRVTYEQNDAIAERDVTFTVSSY